MAGPYAPDSSFIDAIVAALATEIQTQIPSINTVYQQYPDRAPGDNTVVLPLTKYKVMDDTNGKLKVKLTFGGKHLFRRREMGINISQAYGYLLPWLMVISSWTNQSLGGLAISTSVTEGGVAQVAEAGQSMVALIINFDVLTEFNIPVS